MSKFYSNFCFGILDFRRQTVDYQTFRKELDVENLKIFWVRDPLSISTFCIKFLKIMWLLYFLP